MKLKKSFIILLMALILVPINTFAIISKEKEYVTDSASIIDQETEEYIEEYSSFLYEACKIKISAVTIKKLDDLTLEEYAEEIFNEFNLTEKGILILVSEETHSFRIEVGKTLSNLFPNETIEEYINEYMLQYFKNGEWNTGIKNGYSAIYKRICNYYNIDSSEMEVYNGNAFINKYKYIIISVIVLIGTLLANIFSSFLISTFKIRKKLDILDTVILILSLGINIFLIFLLYVIVPKSIIIMLLTELFVGYSSYSFYEESRKIKINQLKKHKIIKKNLRKKQVKNNNTKKRLKRTK